MSPRFPRMFATTLMLGVAACRSAPTLAPRPLVLAAGTADTIRSEAIARGVTLHTLVKLSAPWRAFVLDVDLKCNALDAVKGGSVALGRLTTSQLLQGTAPSDRMIAAVNADFFLFTPPGVPTNAHVERGVLLSGPDLKPVFWRGANNVVGFDTVRVVGTAVVGQRAPVPLTGWNRPARSSNGVIDGRWGAPLDTAVRKRFWRLDPIAPTLHGANTISLSGRYIVRNPRGVDTLVRGDTMLLHLRADAPTPTDGDTMAISVQLTSSAATAAHTRPLHVVGGRPVLVTDSAVTRDADTEGAASFRDLNPRTFMGLDRSGKRAWLVVVDGRQKDYSMGMTLRQEAELMLALGATRALNLDGGGSSALVLRTPAGPLRTVNKPSDAGTERAVANALAVKQTCR